jgi:hypothetical protein
MGIFNTGFFAPDEKRGFINVLVLSFSFCLLFSAFNTAGVSNCPFLQNVDKL